MKKKLLALASVVLAAILTAGISACSNGTEATKLSAMSAATEVINTEIDYYVLPEPAATLMTKKNADLYNVGSLQTLYGEGGYPQAVIIAKKSLIESDGTFVKEFIAAYKNTSTWLSSVTDYSTIITAINNNFTEGSTSTLVVGQLSSTVIANCNISYTSATDDKTNIVNYMNSVNEIEMYGECSDEFFQSESEITSTVSSAETVTVFLPDGAPAISMAYMMSGNVTLPKTVKYTVVNATEIAASTADIIVMPVNAAVKKYGNGENYKLLGTVTHGNLFILSRDNTALTSANLAEKLSGKTVGVMQLPNVPGLTTKIILKKHNITYTTL